MKVLQRKRGLKFHLVIEDWETPTPSGNRHSTVRNLPLCGIRGPSWQLRFDGGHVQGDLCGRCLASAEAAYNVVWKNGFELNA